MSTALAQPSRPSALAQMASRLSLEPERMKATLKATVFSACRNDEELAALVVVSNEYNLNPLLREIYAFPAKGGGIVPVVSVDGWIKLVNSHPQMDGMEFQDNRDANGELESMTCTIWRRDRTRPIVVTEHLSECFRNTEPWKMKHRMLRHKALKECARVAFGFSGVHDEDEAPDVTNPIRAAVGREVVDEAPKLEDKASEPSRRPRATRETAAPEPTSFTGHAGGVYEEGKAGPQNEPEQAAEQAPADTSGKRGIPAYFERIERKELSGGKVKFTVHFQIIGGAFKQADTFSSTLAAVIEGQPEGRLIRVETSPNANARYNDSLTFIELENAEGGEGAWE
jgi:hypothetical protein